eukprot:CAMPEP_0114525608 /NCGR_PEP_ID=MMETSP0109-20121206/22526_1 /TAXON_ID=29199 /ORGANISM="Chlorarachnion reptans, Strain CCCM449" /LENGTH=1065 /DNA_ID=CAMNT_0001707223 /DNA_START=214 /DNA_END=3412 /DNA_ORIENTATION=+
MTGKSYGKMSQFLKDKVELAKNGKDVAKKGKVQVPYDKAPLPDVVLWGIYLLFITGVSTAMMYSSKTLKSFTESGFDFGTLRESIMNFTWKRGETNCSSLQFLVGVHVVYVLVLYLVQTYSASRKTIPGWLPAMRQAHNVLLAVLSGLMLCSLILGGIIDSRFSSFYTFACRRPSESQPGLTVWTMYIFYLSKMLEFLDTFFLILAKKKVILLHKVHHLTTMSLVWHSLNVGINSEILSGGTNCFVHTLMYAYFAFPKGNAWLRKYMTTTQIVQFVLCLTAFFYALKARFVDNTPCYGTFTSELHGIAMYGTYLAMFTAFFIANYCKKGKKGAKEQAGQPAGTADASAKTNSEAKKTPTVQYSFSGKMIIWSCYFALLSAAAGWLLQESRTMKALSVQDMSAEAVVRAALEDIEKFKWVSGGTRGGSWQFLLGVHVVYAAILNVLMYVMQGIPERISWAKPLSKAHNIFMAAISAFMLGVLVYGGVRDGRFSSWDNFVCQRPQHSGLIQWGMYVFYLSKMLEFIDTFLLIMSKKKSDYAPQGPSFDHNVPRLALSGDGPQLRNPVRGIELLRPHSHVRLLRVPERKRVAAKYMTSIQLLQFVFCLVGLVYGAMSRFTESPCAGTALADAHGIAMYGVYLAMFAAFFYDQYIKRGKKARMAKREESKGDAIHEVILFKKRVDVTSFLKKHPGGAKVLHIFRNRDATEQFEAYHSDRAYRWLKALPKRDVLEGDFLSSETDVAKDFKKLINTLKEKGFYKADLVEEFVKLFLVFGPYIFGHYLLWNGMPLAGALSIGWALYYSGWVSHDYLHHAVIRGGPNRDETTGDVVWMNNVMGYIMGFMQGYEVDWWRARHNTHHVVTNEHGNDPDIKTAPVLTFVRNSPAIAKGLNMIQRWQQYYYLPVMCILDLYWRLESFAYIAVRLPKYWKQLALYLASVAWTVYAFHGNYQYFWLMTLYRGFMTGTIVFSTHYGEDILEKGHKLTLVEQTSLTSRNISGGYIANLLTGFLSLQTEHHLFPMMPTAKLAEARPYVMAFFKKHGLEYREGNIIECVRLNIKALAYDHVLG